MSPVVNLLRSVDQGNSGLVDSPGEGTTGMRDTAEGESTEVDIEHQVVQRTEVVEGKTVGKLPQVVYTALERMIHIPHLVLRQKWLVGEETVMYSVTKSVSMRRW